MTKHLVSWSVEEQIIAAALLRGSREGDGDDDDDLYATGHARSDKQDERGQNKPTYLCVDIKMQDYVSLCS